MSDVNPYASPAATPSPGLERSGRLVVRFTIEEEEVLLRSIRTSFLNDEAESLGCAVCLAVFVPAIVLAVTLVQFPLVPIGYVGGAIAALIARQYYLRRVSRRFLVKMQKRIGILPGARCQLELTRTRLLLTVAEKRCGWPLHRLEIRQWRRSPRKPPFVLMSIVAMREWALPVCASADFGDSTPEEFRREFQRRAAACARRRKRRRWRRFFGR